MATFDATFIPTDESIHVDDLANSASTAEIELGTNRKFLINCSGHAHLKFGRTGMAASDATEFRLPQDVSGSFDMGPSKTHIRIFNSSGAAIDCYILPVVNS